MKRTGIAIVSSVLLLGTGAAAANELESASGVQVIARADMPPARPTWLAVQLDRVHLNKKSGLAYTRRVEDHDLELSVKGPVMGSAKRVGIAFELRGSSACRRPRSRRLPPAEKLPGPPPGRRGPAGTRGAPPASPRVLASTARSGG